MAVPAVVAATALHILVHSRFNSAKHPNQFYSIIANLSQKRVKLCICCHTTGADKLMRHALVVYSSVYTSTLNPFQISFQISLGPPMHFGNRFHIMMWFGQSSLNVNQFQMLQTQG